MTVFDLKGGFQYAMHGNGAYRGLRQTNTEDALLYWYGRGIRIFEMDMAVTDDGRYVAVAHDLKDKALRRLELFHAPRVRTAEWFMRQRLFSISTKGLKPLSLESIHALLERYSDILVVYDLFGMFEKAEARGIVEAFSALPHSEAVWDRVLFEAYNMDMADGIAEGNEKANVIYCARHEDNAADEATVSADELKRRGIHFVSYPWFCSAIHPGEIEAFSDAGLTVFSRSKFNTKDELLKKAGVSVNLIAKRFDGWKIAYQWPLYMLTYGKRIAVKLYIKLK